MTNGKIELGVDGSAKILFTNNSRKLAGLPLRRKKNGKKRSYTRFECDEVLDALFDFWNN